MRPGVAIFRTLALLCGLTAACNSFAAVYSHGDPTDMEQWMLELINDSRANPAATAARLGIDLNEGLDPEEISPDPKPPLAFFPNLLFSARAHSDWMLETDTFSHAGENNSEPTDRMVAAGFPLEGSWQTGENIANAGNTGPIDIAELVLMEHEGLFKSPPHRRNLMNPNFAEVGVGIRIGTYSADGFDFNSAMATQNFARSDGTDAPWLLGVVYRDYNSNGAFDPGEGLPDVAISPIGQEDSGITSSSGGYAVPCHGAGEIQVRISGPALSQSVEVTVNRTGTNVKLDWRVDPGSTVTTRLTGITPRPNGSMDITVSGEPGSTIRIGYSADLVEWQLLEEVDLQTETVIVLDETAGARPRTFYRILR